MTPEQLYATLSRSGKYALKYLVRFHHDEYGDLYLVNNNQAVIHDGITYLPSNFSYTRPKVTGGVLQNGELSVTLIGNSLPELFRLGDYLMTVDVMGAVVENGDVAPLRIFHHQYGTMTVTGSMEMTISFTNDDRTGMVFPPNVFDSENNRGNAY